MHDPRHKLIVALDFPTSAEALALVHSLGDTVLWFKVGLELYLAEGASIVRTLKGMGKNIFLDLKLHDIPNTVAAATRIAAHTGADLLTVHALGGPAMLRAAVDAATSTSVKVLAVTVLTSMDAAELHAIGVSAAPAAQVAHLAGMALGTGVQGLICSPLETAALRRAYGTAPLLVVPGIRGAADASDDQQRIATPGQAIFDGASMLVVGRPITRAADPFAAAAAILDNMRNASSSAARPLTKG